MFFVASKVFWFVLAPSNALLLGLVLATVWMSWAAQYRPRTRGKARALLYFCVVALGLTITPLGQIPLAMVEDRFPAIAYEDVPRDLAGIVVLGGALDIRRTEQRRQPQLNDAAERITALVSLAAARPDLPIIISGGQGALHPSDLSEAEAVTDLLADMDVGRGRLQLETRSRNTHENATYTRELVVQAGLSDGRWLLVTSAFHMPRAVGSFRTAGFDVVAFPVDYRLPLGGSGLAPLSKALTLLDVGVREWIGLVAYRLAGYTSSLWPGPAGGNASR